MIRGKNLKVCSQAIASIVVVCLSAASVQAATHYVNWNAIGANNGTSWVNAFTSLQTVLAAAVSGDEIWVAAGTSSPAPVTPKPAGPGGDLNGDEGLDLANTGENSDQGMTGPAPIVDVGAYQYASTYDYDQDGIFDGQDNCPTVPNPDQADSDRDYVGDDCDNCPNTPNLDQSDTDADGRGDACDEDADGDGVPNDQDICPQIYNPDQEYVGTRVSISVDPDPKEEVCAGFPAIFSVTATGDPAPSYQWQVMPSGGSTWSDIEGATGSGYDLLPAISDNGSSYRCVVTNPCGSETSDEALLTVHAPPSFDVQPLEATICTGGMASFSVTASGAATYQWQVNAAGESVWNDILEATGASYGLTALASHQGKKYRCAIRNEWCTVYSDAAGLMISDAELPPPGMTERLSVDSSGTQADFYSYNPSISADGRYVAFYSEASNLVPGDTNLKVDIFVRDRLTGTTERVSVSSEGTQANSDSFYPSISADGRYVAFVTIADNLVPGDTNGETDVFVRDRQTGTTELVSVSILEGTQANSHSYSPSISADGRYVAFESDADNLVMYDTNGMRDVFVRDRQTLITRRVSVNSSGTQGNGYSYDPSISADGRFVAFESQASNLVLGDSNEMPDVFVRDRDTDNDGIFDEINAVSTERVSVSSGGEGEGGVPGMHPSISADGRYVAFKSEAGNLVPDDTNGTGDIFVRDRQTGTTERISVNSSGEQSNGWSFSPSISADGRYVTFISNDPDLAPGGMGGMGDANNVYVRDRLTGITERVSVSWSGEQANSDSQSPSISGNGRHVAFASSANNLVPDDDTNESYDIFVRDRGYVWRGGRVMYVRASAADGGDGNSWEMALKDLQEALTIAASHSGPAIEEIWVAAGEYKPALPAAPPPGESRCATFRLINGLALYGGFAGNEDPATFDLNNRDFQANETKLTNNPGNCRNVVTGPAATGASNWPVLDGFTITADANTPVDAVGEFCLDGKVAVTNCIIQTEGIRYLDLDPVPDNIEPPELSNNSMQVKISSSGMESVSGSLLDLRAHDFDCGGPPCPSGAHDAAGSTVFSMDPSPNWVLESLEILRGAKVNLTNRPGLQFLPNDETEAIYVRNLTLHKNATLNTGLQTLYYKSLQDENGNTLYPDQLTDGRKIVDEPLLGFSLGIIAMDDQTEFNVRVRTRTRDETDPQKQGSVTRFPYGSGGVMDMRTFNQASGMQTVVSSVAAKGSFARAGDEDIIITFDYLFKDAPEGTQINVYLSDQPNVGANLLKVAELHPPPAYMAGGTDSGDQFALFRGRFPRGGLVFARGTYVELELVSVDNSNNPLPARVLIDNFDPQITCSQNCGSFDPNQGIDDIDYLYLLAEVGQALPSDKGCLDLSDDGYLDLGDILKWDIIYNQTVRPCWTTKHGACCKDGQCLWGIQSWCEAIGGTYKGDGIVCTPTRCPPPPGAPPGASQEKADQLLGVSPGELAVLGKPNKPQDDPQLQNDLWYRVSKQGTGLGTGQALACPSGLDCSRGAARLISSPKGITYLVHVANGVSRLDNGELLVGACDINYTQNGVIKTVRVGIAGNGTGPGLMDAAFDVGDLGPTPTSVYVAPVQVHVPAAQGIPEHIYKAAARLVWENGAWKVYALYGADPVAAAGTPNLPCDKGVVTVAGAYCKPLCDLTAVREIEVDSAGNVYVVSASQYNDNDWLIVYSSDGTEIARHNLDSPPPGSDFPVPESPAALLVSKTTGKLYLSPSSGAFGGLVTRVYRYTIGGGGATLTFDGAVQIDAADNATPDCPQSQNCVGYGSAVTSIQESNDDSLYVLGYTMPHYAEDKTLSSLVTTIFTVPTLAVIPSISSPATWSKLQGSAITRDAVKIAGGGSDLALPLAMVLGPEANPADFNGDTLVNGTDMNIFDACYSGPQVPYIPGQLPAGCTFVPNPTTGYIPADFDRDGDVDQVDFGTFQRAIGSSG